MLYVYVHKYTAVDISIIKQYFWSTRNQFSKGEVYPPFSVAGEKHNRYE